MTFEASLRARPHSHKLWLSIYNPKVMLSCQVNDALIDVGEDEITYNNVVTGSYPNVRSGMTMYVGSAPGTWDYGRIRVRYASSTGTIRIAENSEINWQDDLYLTVVDFYEIWSVFPDYEMDGDDVIFYKDKDTVYTNQNSDAGMGTIVNMGAPHSAGSVPMQVYYSATGSFSPSNSLPLTYSWFFEGGTPTGSSSATPGIVTYNTPGHYTARLTVTNNNGVQDTSYRHVSVYGSPDSGINQPILDWELVNLKGSRQEGGYTATIRVHQSASNVVDGALVVVFADSISWGSTFDVSGSVSNYSLGGKNIFTGYILNGSIRYNYQASYVEFDVGSSSEIMKQQPGLSVSVDSVETPATWYELDDMDIAKIVYHYFRWHSTLLNTNDLLVMAENKKFQYFDSESSTLYDAMQSFLQSSLLGYMVCDIHNRMYIEDGPETLNYGSLALDYTLLRQDWMDEPEIIERPIKEVSYLELSGVAWAGSATGTWAEYISAAPGNSFAYYGSLEQQTGLILTSQDMLNTLTGRVYAYKNARFPEITTRLAGAYKTFDIAPIKKYQMTILPGDTVRGINFVNKPMHISEIAWEYDPKNQALVPEVVFHEFTDSYPGVTIIRPQTPIVNPPSQPPIVLPPFPIIPTPTPFPVPPPTVPVPPDVEDCMGLLDPPDNGPFVIASNVELISTHDGYFFPFACQIRCFNGGTYATYIHFDGTWEESTDNGVTWTPWNTTINLVVTYMVGGSEVSGGGYDGTVVNWDSYAGNSPEDRHGYLSSCRAIDGFIFRVKGIAGIASTPYDVTYQGLANDEGSYMGALPIHTWNPNTWRGTAHWYSETPLGFPTYQRHMLMTIPPELYTGSFTFLIGSRYDYNETGLPRYDYDNASPPRLSRMRDPGGTISGAAAHEGITGTYDGEWHCVSGIYGPHFSNTGTVYLGHFFGVEGRTENGMWDRSWEIAILSINGLTPLGTIYKFRGDITLYNIC